MRLPQRTGAEKSAQIAATAGRCTRQRQGPGIQAMPWKTPIDDDLTTRASYQRTAIETAKTKQLAENYPAAPCVPESFGYYYAFPLGTGKQYKGLESDLVRVLFTVAFAAD
jgi:hypothetical protein